MIYIKLDTCIFQVTTFFNNKIKYLKLRQSRVVVTLRVGGIQSTLKSFSGWSVEGFVKKVSCALDFISYNLLRAYCVS